MVTNDKIKVLEELYSNSFKVKSDWDKIHKLLFILCVIVLFFFFLLIFSYKEAKAQNIPCPTVNLSIISRIESNNDNLAYNRRSGARGAFQITQPCLDDYNACNSPQIAKKDLFQAHIGRKISGWYLNNRIPALLKHFKLQDTLENRLRAYNQGIGSILKGNYPKETKDYIIKYKRLAKEE